MNDKEKPALEKAADKVNDVVEEIALKAADAAIEPDPVHVAGTSNEQLYLPETQSQVPSTADAHPQSPIKKKEKPKH
jgi:hypothetical protein